MADWEIRKGPAGTYLPPIEWANRTYKWVWYERYLPMEFRGRIVKMWFSCSRDEFWWYKLGIPRRYGPNVHVNETPWQPIPGFDFVLPETVRLMKETAILPKMTPAEWLQRKREAEEFDRAS